MNECLVGCSAYSGLDETMICPEGGANASRRQAVNTGLIMELPGDLQSVTKNQDFFPQIMILKSFPYNLIGPEVQTVTGVSGLVAEHTALASGWIMELRVCPENSFCL